MVIKYLYASLVDCGFVLYLTLFVAFCLLVTSLAIGRLSRCLCTYIDADSSLNWQLIMLEISIDTLITESKVGFSVIRYYFWSYVICDWFHRKIIAKGGSDWLAKNGEILDNTNPLIDFRAIYDRICLKDRTVSLIFFSNNSVI